MGEHFEVAICCYYLVAVGWHISGTVGVAGALSAAGPVVAAGSRHSTFVGVK